MTDFESAQQEVARLMGVAESIAAKTAAARGERSARVEAGGSAVPASRVSEVIPPTVPRRCGPARGRAGRRAGARPFRACS